MEVYSVLIYDRKLTNEEIQTIVKAENQKYNLDI